MKSLSTTFKHAILKWKIVDKFNLNMTFVAFDLKYSGEACLQERVIVNVTGMTTIGRYCGRRYIFSIFASLSPITLDFQTFELSTSTFTLKYQITDTILKTVMHNFKNCDDINVVENITFVHPFSWNHIYILENTSHYTWNIIVPKMYRLLIKFLKVCLSRKSIILFDGPDFHNKELESNFKQIMIASTFQVFILYLNHNNKQINLIFSNYLMKDKVEYNYKIYDINREIQLNNNLSIIHLTTLFYSYKLHVPRHYYVNITLLSLEYSGPNVGYCKYGGLSIYDFIYSQMKEVFLLCDQVFPATLHTQPKHIIISSTQHLFLIFYAYRPYSEIKPHITIKPTTCKGVHIFRYNFIIVGFVP